jgi:hypothetical protein
MKVSGDKKSIPIYLDISLIFFHIFPEFVHALVMFDEIFSSPGCGRRCPPETISDLGSEDVVRWKSSALDFHAVGKVKKEVSEVCNFHVTTASRPGSRNGVWSRMSPFTARDWKITSYVMVSV